MITNNLKATIVANNQNATQFYQQTEDDNCRQESENDNCHKRSANHNSHQQEYTNRKDHFLIRLKRMIPGSTTGLNALEEPCTGGIVTEPREMARLLTEHRGKVLTAKPVDSRLLSRWLRDIHDKLPPASDGRWRP